MKSLPKIIHNLYDRIFPEPLMLKPIWLNIDHRFCLKIDSTATLNLFTDIFVNQQYVQAFDLLNSPQVIVDLGANRGLFLIYSCFILGKRNQLANTRFICVEPAEGNFQILMEHISENNLGGIVTPIQGAVADKRSGTVPFYYLSKYHVTGKVAQGNKLTTRMVPVVDLAQYVQNYPAIDLLKVDIEGSEQAFFQEYQDIIQRTKVMVIEFHLNYIDYKELRSKLLRNGLVYYQQAYEFNDNLVVEIYFNPALNK